MAGVKGGDLIQLNVIASAALPSKRFVSPTGGVPAANGNTIGVNDYAVVSGETALVDHVGQTIVEAGAALAPGTNIWLSTNASGQAIAWTANAVRVALLVQHPNNIATAAGQTVSVIAISNSGPTA